MPKHIYAIRGGSGHGIYETYADAVDGGWSQRQGYGNAMKFEEAQRPFAEEWLKRTPLPNGRAASAQSWVKKQHFLVRITITGIIASISFAAIFHFCIWFHNYVGCDGLTMATTPACKGVLQMRLFVSDKLVELTNLLFAQVISAIGVFAMYVGGMLN